MVSTQLMVPLPGFKCGLFLTKKRCSHWRLLSLT